MGEKSFRILIDSKSRGSGIVQQNDVNIHALRKQKTKASADYLAVIAADFSAGNLAEFAAENQVRLIRTNELRELMLAHTQSVFPLDVLRPFFVGGGLSDEGVLSEILTSAESKSDVMTLARKVYIAVRQYQDQEGVLQPDSLYYILKCEYPLPIVKLTVDFLKSELIGALADTDAKSLGSIPFPG